MTPDKNSPFLAAIKDKYFLTSPSSPKRTQHIVLDIEHSGITYEVGDCVGVYPTHDPDIVQRTLAAMKASGDEIVVEKKTQALCRLADFLHRKVSLSHINRKLVMTFAEKQTDEARKLALLALLEKENRDELKHYMELPLWAFLEEHREVTLPPQDICDALQPLLPRFYSIASSQTHAPNEVHLTVGMLEYEHKGIEKKGVCTHYLCNLTVAKAAKVPIYIHKHRGFTLPQNGDTPIIMIGPGTGIAPFRGFMQERIATGAKGANWLFFGDWTAENEFYYGDYWHRLENEGRLRLDLAFSRDQEHKIYVQHRMKENGADLYRWLQAGAVLYVCGDMHRMAKDVDAMLHHIIETHGQMDPQKAKDVVSSLKKEGRYLRDVY